MKKILVIENDSELRSNLCEMLGFSGYEVYEAENGKKGMEKAAAVSPDLILCDTVMPELDGFCVLFLIQNNPQLQNTPFIFLSGRGEPADINRGLSCGADDYITKPFDTADLLGRVEYRLRKADLLKAHVAGKYPVTRKRFSLTEGETTLTTFVRGRAVEMVRKKQFIFSEGNRPERVFFLKKGRVKVYKKNHQQKELIVRIVEEGDLFGYVALLQDTNYQASAEALDDCELVAIPRKEFEELLNNSPDISKKMIRLLAKDVLHMEENMIHIAYNSLRRKVADALLSIYQKTGYNRQSVNFTRENIAAITGAAAESVSRTLSEFKHEQLIDTVEGKITIIDLERIKNVSG